MNELILIYFDKSNSNFNFSFNIFANSSWSCILIPASKVPWRVQMTVARQSSRFCEVHMVHSAMPVREVCGNDWKGTTATL